MSASFSEPGGDGDVAGAGADDLDQNARGDAAANGAEVGVKGADGHRNARRQAGFRGPGGGQSADGAVHRFHPWAQPFAQGGQTGVELAQEFGVGIAAPFRAVHGLVSRRANSGGEFFGRQGAGEFGRHVISQLDPGMGGFENLRVGAGAMQDFAEEPFAGIGAAALGQVLRTNLAGQRGDLRRFRRAGVVLPEPGQRGRVGGEFFGVGERLAVSVHWHGRAARRVHSDADDLFRLEAANGFFGGGQGLFDGDLRARDVIGRMLARQVRVAAQNHPLRPVFVAPDGGGRLVPVGGVDNQSPHRVGSIVQSDDIFRVHNNNLIDLIWVSIQ